MDLSPPATPDQLDALEAQIDAWLAAEATENPMIDAVEKGERGIGHPWKCWRSIEKGYVFQNLPRFGVPRTWR